MPDDTADDDVLSDGSPARRYRRHSEELEFDRVAFFSDAVFAIAMTLLVVGIGIPHVRPSRLEAALRAKDSEIGTNSNRPITITLYAVTLGVASLLEAVMLWYVQRAGLLRARLRDDIFRAYLLASLAPVVVFALSIPVAYLAADRALLVWSLIFPLEWAIGGFVTPKDAKEF